VAPRRKVANAPEERPVYTGERLTLNFQDIETRAVLQLLADASGQNIVVSDSVTGNVTLRLQNVPWTRRSISCCAPRVSTSAGRTTSSSWLRRPSSPPREGRPGREEGRAGARAAALRVLQVNYAKAQDMAGLIKTRPIRCCPARQRGGRRSHQHPAAAGHRRPARGRAPPVATLDIPVRQVLIERASSS